MNTGEEGSNYVAEDALPIFSSPWILVSNVFLILVILMNKKMRKKKPACLVLNLAIADLLVGFVTPWYNYVGQMIFPLIDHIKQSEETISYACLCVLSLQGFAIQCSGTMFFMINLERYLFICHSFWYRKTLRLRHIICMACAAWLAALLISVPGFATQLSHFDEYYVEHPNSTTLFNISRCRDAEDLYYADHYSMLIWSVPYCLIPVPIIIFFNMRIVLIAHRSVKARLTLIPLSNRGYSNTSATETTDSKTSMPQQTSTPGSRQGDNSDVTLRKPNLLQKNLIKNIRTLLIFNIFWATMSIPYVVVAIVSTVFPSTSNTDEMRKTISALLWISCLNSGVNPLLWLQYPEYRQAYCILFKRIACFNKCRAEE